MRITLIAFISLTCIQSILYADFYENPNNESARQAIYVEPKDITLTQDGIYWDCEGYRIPIQSLHSDSGGLIATANRDDRNYMHFKCPGCGRWYSWYENCSTDGCIYNTRKK